jgi:hypothetical protein
MLAKEVAPVLLLLLLLLLLLYRVRSRSEESTRDLNSTLVIKSKTCTYSMEIRIKDDSERSNGWMLYSGGLTNI